MGELLMKTTTLTVNAECPGCGKECPPKLGIPGSHQHGWEWDGQTEQRWCRACYTSLKAGRHFKAVGWVWKVTWHDGRVKYLDTLTDYILLNDTYGRATVTTVYDPDRIFIPPANAEEFKELMKEAVEALRENGPDIPDRYMVIHTANADALREEMES